MTSTRGKHRPDMLALIMSQRRETLGLTQEQAAKLAGLGRTTISDFETGKRSPSLLTLHRYAAALDCALTIIHDGQTVERTR